MRVTLRQEDFDAMVSYALSRRPQEACGLIAGEDETVTGEPASETVRHIRKVVFLTNTDQSAEHFSLDPREQLQAVKDFRKAGLKPLGNWHSHPASPSRPSAEDIRLSFDSRATYMILSLMDEQHPVLNAFHVENGQVRKEEIEIISGS